MNETAIVTGANGFIGSHLTKALQARSIEVIPLHHTDLLFPNTLQKQLKELQPAYIFHLAAYGNHGQQHDIDKTIQANILGTYHLLSASVGIPYKAFVNFGTSSEYGKKDAPMWEGSVLEPDTFYAATKAAATHLARVFAKQFDKPIVTIRPFSVYGPGEADWRFIPTVCKGIVTGKPIPVVRYPEHDWIYIDDFISGVLFAMTNPEVELLNIGTGKAYANDEILNTLSYIADKAIITNEDAYKEQPHHSSIWIADNWKLTKLGWRQTVKLEEGLKRTWEYYSKKYET